MRLPNWFKVVWWLLLIGLLTFFLYRRYPQLITGDAVLADIIVFIIWISLLLAPLFSEVTLLGIKLKQQIDDLKESISSQITDVKNEVKNAVDVRATFSPHFNIPPPAPDAKLPDLEQGIKAAVSDALAAHGIQKPPPAQISVPQNVSSLFAVRYNLEKELRHIAEARELFNDGRRPAPISFITRALIQEELLEPNLGHAIREVYSVCSPAVHGEPVTDAQVAFVGDVGPELIATLRAIS